MNFRATAKFTGLNVATAAQTFQAANRLSVEQAAEVVLEEAEALVPVDTGDLRESGHIEVMDAGTSQLTASARVIFDSPHAAFVEYGTGIRGASSPSAGPFPYDPNWPGMPAQPYLRPGLDTARPAMAEIFRDNYAAATKLLGI